MVKKLILNNDYAAIRKALSEDPQLINEGLAFDEHNTILNHPLHRICDLVFSGKLTDEEAVKIAEIFLEYGANLEGNDVKIKKDTPLIAASSLHADKVAILYLNQNANITHQGTHGGTALHWASWCGRDVVVKRLLSERADIDKRCIDFQATPLFWAIKSFKEKKDKYNQLECIKLLIEAGADKKITNGEGTSIYNLIDGEDLELRNIILN